jgi:magnesium transporter
MRNPLLVPEVRELLLEGKREDLVSVLSEMHPSDAAATMNALEPAEVATLMALLPVELERDVFGYLDPDVQEEFVAGGGRDSVKNVLLSMFSDDRAEFVDRLEERVRQKIWPLLSNAAREDLLHRSAFREDQVGSFLSTDYAVLSPQLSARSAIAELRRQAPSKETIYYSYVVDRLGRLVGFLSLRDLILAKDDQTVAEMMRTEIVSTSPEADQEEAARLIRDYDLIALPVVDSEQRLIGIVTHDDAVDIVEEEAEEDFAKMAGMTGESEGETYLDEPVLRQVRRRAPVICILAMFWLVTGSVIRGFEHQLHGDTLLLVLMPMVMAIGGMVGSQASTLIVRAVSSGGLAGSLWLVLWKELRVSLLLAAILSCIAFANAWLLQHFTGAQEPVQLTSHVAIVIAIAMSATVLLAALLGATTPYFVKVLRIDPALISTPAVTALTDLTGAAIYLLVVTVMI